MRDPFRRRRGLSPVISAIILSAVVIAVGGMVWSYAQGASTVIATDYTNNTLDLLNEVTERFTVEHVTNNSQGDTLTIWIYNYGEVDIVIDVYAAGNNTENNTLGTSLVAGNLTQVQVYFTSDTLDINEVVMITVYSRRQNVVYSKYVVI